MLLCSMAQYITNEKTMRYQLCFRSNACCRLDFRHKLDYFRTHCITTAFRCIALVYASCLFAVAASSNNGSELIRPEEDWIAGVLEFWVRM